jgi:hypothetical protein
MIINIVEKRDDSPFMWQCDDRSGPVWLAQLGDESFDVWSISYSEIPWKMDCFGNEVVNGWP